MESTEYKRGYEDAKKHGRLTDPNWVRATFGPILWLGIPLAATMWYMRRPTVKGWPVLNFGKKAAGKEGEKKKESMNPFGDMMEMMMPIQKREFRVDVKGTKFADVIGIPEAKEEVMQYVQFLRTPDKFTRLGARLPKGCLLTGEPGTGKTLLAKAVAGEAEVPFFSCSGADFIEIMGGSGPKRVRDLFREARENAPCIIFIDEIDAIGSRGGKQGGSVSSEENRTINQLLAELDGLATGDLPVVVMAATNFQDNIDKAMLREGRFDRKINIDMPDVAARRDIFKHYLAKVVTGDAKGKLKIDDGEAIPADPSVDNEVFAKHLADLTPGISPASCATIVNEAALSCAIQGKKQVDLVALREAIDNVQIGKKHRNRMNDSTIRRTAVHEAGHALAMWLLPQQKNVLKISVTPRGHAMGYTQKAGSEFHEYQTNVTMFTDLVVMMGGRAAEDVLYGDPSIGAMDDLQRATSLAIQQLLSHGMSQNVGMLAFHPQEATDAGRSWVHYSEGTQVHVEAEAKRLLEAAYRHCKTLIEQNKDKINAMADLLVDKKEVITEDIEKLWGPRPSTPTNEEIAKEIEVVMDTSNPIPQAAGTVAAKASA
jgi:ATP-dependent metalloprotease FtsH